MGAYPFSDSETGHRVDLPALSVGAMCAVDALGMGAMLDQNSVIRSSCLRCGQAIRIATRHRGRERAGISPEDAVAWSGVVESVACAATSLCTVQAFFCSDEHLERSRAASPADNATGFRLSVDEALQFGRAVFAPMLRASR